MSRLKIGKVSEGERCWGVELFDESGALLRSLEGVGAVEVRSVAEVLKSEGPGAPVLEDSKVEPDEAAWVIEKVRGGWAVRFTPVAATLFELLMRLDGEGEPSKAAEETLALVKKCLAGAEIVWEPPITIKIDGELHEALENPMSANEILQLGKLDPNTYYLVEIKDGERIKYDGRGEEPVSLYDGAEFVGHFTGEKPVSQLDG
ncbi:hypothetical protein [Candidatus Palauibacter irciniicola]|uniref:hypothetical protein n=1 Tax=Candidatus Palauibacter irciniicola TaxID=3056733 RepID=UPI003B024459